MNELSFEHVLTKATRATLSDFEVAFERATRVSDDAPGMEDVEDSVMDIGDMQESAKFRVFIDGKDVEFELACVLRGDIEDSGTEKEFDHSVEFELRITTW